ncbi:tubulin-specific chaperone C-like [Daphnia pulicaria]|uniref:tubulin-specific chaperone C-like n=1 Tax=Daphnia pulicaria TaxID=35523 RepID=UPI001EEA4CE7|nr:tubulin-specific chaperone C-like [Daphnia pulicaria]
MSQQQLAAFLSELNLLEQKVNNLVSGENVNTNVASEALQNLTRFVSENAPSLPAYELRRAHGEIMKLKTRILEIEEKTRRQGKFKFTRTNKEKPQVMSLPTECPEEKISSATERPSRGLLPTLINLTNETITIDSMESSSKDIWLDNLEKSTIIIKGIPSALHMTNLRDCKIIGGPVLTSVFLEDCFHSIFVVGCQQMRIHKSKECDFYLHICSRVIVEDCFACRFAPYNREYCEKAEEFSRANLELSVNHWNCIDDFNWLSVEQSPNWSILPEDKRIKL